MSKRFEEMSHEEVVTLSLQKDKKGCATEEALKAQKYLWVNGSRWGGCQSTRHRCWCLSDEL